MSARLTWIWLAIAATLAGFIYVSNHYLRKPEPGPLLVLPEFKPGEITAIQVRSAGELEMRVERTNNTWQMVHPLAYPAQAPSIENLLTALERLVPATFIAATELRDRPNADDEYGFASPLASIMLYRRDERRQLKIGAKTNPGDQVFLQVVGNQGVYVVDAEFLKLIPRSASDWRDTRFFRLDQLTFNRLSVTNGQKYFELQRETSGPWRITWPVPARADQAKVEQSLKNLENLRVQNFVSDESRADLDRFGLQPADLSFGVFRSNTILDCIYFGRSPTNEPRLVYARRSGLDSIVTVPRDLAEPWRATANDFRDPHLLSLEMDVNAVEVQAADNFALQRGTNGAWRVSPPNFAADAELMKEFFSLLGSLRISQFVSDVVTEPDLPAYGLNNPMRRYTMKMAGTNAAPATNLLSLQLSFGTNRQDQVFVRRGDENSVYAITVGDFNRLPYASWQFRERKLWSFSLDDISRLVLRQNGKERQVVRRGLHQWSLAPGSQGIINDLAVEETAKSLVQLSAVSWVARGRDLRARFGFTENAHQVVFELKNGTRFGFELGGEAPSGIRFGGTELDGDFWVFEFPWPLSRDVASYLSVPASNF
jgi:hypothetical protein